MVIFLPIAQLGCLSASSTLISLICSMVLPLNGPPEAVRSILWILFCLSPLRHWNIALCSLSTGRILTPFSAASFIIMCPAVTSVSLFARAISLPALIASIVGTIPIMPTTAVTTISACSIAAAWISPSIPVPYSIPVTSESLALSLASALSSAIETKSGLNSLTCCSKSSTLFPADRATTLISLFFLTTSRVWVPIEPVDPSTDIFFKAKTSFPGKLKHP